MSTGVTTPPETQDTSVNGAHDFSRPRRREVRERSISVGLLLATSVGLVFLAILIVQVVADGLRFLSIDFLTSFPSRLNPAESGITAGLTGTMSLMLLVAVASFPLGVGAAVYLEEFAPKNWVTNLIETNISNLAGVPSVVYGLLGAGLFVGILDVGRSLLAGAATLVLLILPVIIVTGREAIKAVPKELREGGLALGATRWQTTWKLTLPQALPGMITGAILGLSRAIGEAAPILVVGATTSRFQRSTPFDLFEKFAALPIDIFTFTFDFQPILQQKAASAIVVLLSVLLMMNGIAIYFRHRARKSAGR